MSLEDGEQYYRFLIDAESNDQYMISLDASKTRQKKPLIFNMGANAPQAKKIRSLQPNEALLAFSDHPKFVLNKEGTKPAMVKTTLYQIAREGDAEAVVKSLDVNYSMTLSKDTKGGGLIVKYTMLEESMDRLEKANFRRDLKMKILAAMDYKEILPPPAKPGDKTIPHFPPHNKKGAYEARGVAETLSTAERTASTPVEKKEDQKMHAVSGDFKKAANPFDPKVPESECHFTSHDVEKSLAQYTVDLTEKARKGQLPPAVGCKEDVLKMAAALLRQSNAGLMVTGGPGVGKSIRAEAFAHWIATGGDEVPMPLRGAELLKLDLSKIIGQPDMMYQGKFEAALRPIFEGLQERKGWVNGKKRILFLDEFPEQLDIGRGEARRLIMDYITAEGTAMIGATTLDEYRVLTDKHKAIERRMPAQVIPAPNAAETKEILKQVWPHQNKHHRLEQDLTQEQIDFIVRTTDRLMPSLEQPSKSLSVVDTAAAKVVLKGGKGITIDDICETIAGIAKVPAKFVSGGDGERYLSLEKNLPERILGQPDVAKISKHLKRARAGLTDPRKPLGAFLATGPSRSGKTETARALAKELFGSEEAMIRIDMSEYMQDFTVSKLQGSPPGYVGYNDKPVFERIRENPNCVFLLDEIEKAHPRVLDLLLGILDNGEAEDMHGRKIKFNNTIIMMTSNLGAREALNANEAAGKAPKPVGFQPSFNKPAEDAKTQEGLDKSVTAPYEKALRDNLRPELLNRVKENGGILIYLPLDETALRGITKREVAAIEKRLQDPFTGVPQASLRISASLEDEVIELCHANPASGAGMISGAIGEKVGDALADVLLRRKAELEKMVADHGHVTVTIGKPGEEVVFTPGRSAANDSTPIIQPKTMPGGPRAAA